MLTRARLAGLIVVMTAALGMGCSADADADPSDPSGEGTKSGGGGGGGGGGDGPDVPPAVPGKVGCEQAEYTEPLPTNASLSGLSFSASQAEAYLLSALEIRYPVGKGLVDGGLEVAPQNCVSSFLRPSSDANGVLRQASTVVHECGHFFDIYQGGARESVYVIRPDELTFTCSDGDTTARRGKTFARSLITGDAYATLRPACQGSGGRGCDFYAKTYLSNDAMGNQGYNMLLEETTQYVNSLATALAFEESYAGSMSSERDGILTFLWYVERYLAMARADYPDAYAFLSEDSCWRQATLTVWDRAWFYLRATEGKKSLGIEDAAIEQLVNAPELLAEIDALRELECQ